MLMWHKIWNYVLGFEPPFKFVSAVPAIIVFYTTTFLICFSLYAFVKRFIPQPFKEYALDYVQAVTFCTYPFGHGIVRQHFGQTGYMLVMVPLVMFTCECLPCGVGNPVSVWLKYIRGEIYSLKKCVLKIVMCILGGWSAFKLGMFIFAIELHPYYVSTVRDPHCSSDLNVPMYSGLVIEFIGCLYDTWLCLQLLSKSRVLDDTLKCINGGILVGFGVNLTGMYMHPAMATGHTFGCGKTPVFSHVLVYWIAPLAAASLAIELDSMFHLHLFPRPIKPQGPVDSPARSSEHKHKERDTNHKNTGSISQSHENGFVSNQEKHDHNEPIKIHENDVTLEHKAALRQRYPIATGQPPVQPIRSRSDSTDRQGRVKITCTAENGKAIKVPKQRK